MSAWLSTTAVIALLASSVAALASDVWVRNAPPPTPMFTSIWYNWNGFYLGGNVGGALSTGTLTDSLAGASFTGNTFGSVGGGQIGYNWQVAPQIVLGAEGMVDGTSLSKSSSAVNISNGDTLQGDAHTNLVVTLAARFGYAADNALFYGKAGGGWVRNIANINDLTTGVGFSNSNTNNGWLLGVGVEYGIMPNWTVKAEYDYLGLRNWTSSSPLLVGDTVTLSRQINMFMVGTNYKFTTRPY